MLAISKDGCAHRAAGPAQEAGGLKRGVMQHERDTGHIRRTVENGSCPSGFLCWALFSATLTLFD